MTDCQGSDDETDGLRQGDAAILVRREAILAREFGKQRPEHGRDQAVHENSQNGGGDQAAFRNGCGHRDVIVSRIQGGPVRGVYNHSMRKLPLEVCLALALPYGLAASSFDNHMTKGRAAIAGGDFSAAEREYRAALREVRRRLGDMRVFLAYEGSRIPRNGSKMCLPQSNTYGTRWRRVGRLASARWQNCPRGSTSSGSTLNTSFGWTARGPPIASSASGKSAAGFFYRSAGDYAKAEERYRAALPILDAAKGNSAALAQVVGRLASTLAAEDKRDEAEAQFKRAMMMAENGRWPNSVRRDYIDFLWRGRDADADALEKSMPVPTAARVGRGVTAPQLIDHPYPEYREAARVGHFMGTVVLYIEVDSIGRPVNIQVLEPLGFGLEEKAVAAVEAWRFRPGTKDGEALKVVATIEG